MIKMLKTLNGVTEGKYKVTTESGSIYVIDLDEMTLTRNPPEGVNTLIYDGLPIPFERFTCVEGYSMVFESGGHSTPVIDIEEVK